MALGLVGESRYVANTREWETCETYFPLAYRKLLAAHDWTFARRRVTLHKEENGYKLPEDCLRVVQLRGLRNWSICGKYIVNDGQYEPEGVVIFYTSNMLAQHGDVSDVQPFFVELLVLSLASYLAVPIGSDQNLRLSLEQEYKMKLDSFITEDTRQDGSNDQHPLQELMNNSITGGSCYGA